MHEGKSKFDGGAFALIGTWLLMFLIICIMGGMGAGIAYAIGAFEADATPLTFGIGIAVTAVLAWIGFCWGMIVVIKFDTKHTVISGQRLKFKVGTLNLILNCIKWLLLSVITLGIYLLWLPVKIKQWQVKNTVIDYSKDDDNEEYGYGQPEINFYEYDEVYEVEE